MIDIVFCSTVVDWWCQTTTETSSNFFLAIFKMFSFFTTRSGYLAVPVAMGAGLAFQLNRTPPPPRVVVVGGGIMGAATGKLHFSLSFQGLVVAPRFIICLYGGYAVYAGACATGIDPNATRCIRTCALFVTNV